MTINGKFYRDVELDFNTVCELESMGVSITAIEDNVFSAARAYAAICMHKPLKAAGAEIEAHIISGGSMKDIYEAFGRKVEESGFFQKLRESAAEETEAIPNEAMPETTKAKAVKKIEEA